MKRYISCTGSTIQTYKDINIYWNESKGYIYIYTQPHGYGKMEFESIQEAKDYIDQMLGSVSTLSKYRVWFWNTANRDDSYVVVDATDEADAKKKAKQRIGREFVAVSDIQKL